MQTGAISLFIGETTFINLAHVSSAQWESEKLLVVNMLSGVHYDFGAAVGKKFIEALLLFHDLQNKEK